MEKLTRLDYATAVASGFLIICNFR